MRESPDGLARPVAIPADPGGLVVVFFQCGARVEGVQQSPKTPGVGVVSATGEDLRPDRISGSKGGTCACQPPITRRSANGNWGGR